MADIPRVNVTVFASASAGTAPRYMAAAAAMGRGLAEAQALCINGGGRTGCMGALNQAAKEAGCRVRGVIHSMWIGEEDAKGLDEMIVVGGRDLTERKRRLLEDADVLVALPGGVGTLDEFFEAVAGVHTRLSTLPIVLVNVDGYYDGVLPPCPCRSVCPASRDAAEQRCPACAGSIQQLDRARRDGLLSADWRGEGGGGSGGLLHVVDSAEEAVAFCVRRIEATHTLHVHPPALAAPRDPQARVSPRSAPHLWSRLYRLAIVGRRVPQRWRSGVSGWTG